MKKSEGLIYTVLLLHTIVPRDVCDLVIGVFMKFCNIRQRIIDRNCHLQR